GSSLGMRKTHHTGGTIYIQNYSDVKCSTGCKRNRSTVQLATGLAFPVVPNLASLDEFRRDRRDHDVPAAWPLGGRRKSAHRGALRPISMELHVTVSWFLFSPIHAPS